MYLLAYATLLFMFFCQINATPTQEHIVSLHYNFANNGAIETHILKLNKLFNEHNIPSSILTSTASRYVIEQSQLAKKPCYIFKHNDWLPNLEDLEAIHAIKPITILICNATGHLKTALAFKKKHRSKIIFTHHYHLSNFLLDNISLINETDAVITVSTLVVDNLKELQKKQMLTVPIIQHIAPFWADEQFINFIPLRSRKDFFLQQYNLTIEDTTPIITMIAGLHWYKNHAVLLHAAQKLAFINSNFKILLAGEGTYRTMLQELVQTLNINNFVYFLGSTNTVPELLHHTDIHLLSSSHEGLGVAHLEAAIMHKPFIGATQTGIQKCIQPNYNGLFFENNNAESLSTTLQFLLQNKERRIFMGNNAYSYVQTYYSSQALLNNWITLLKNL